MRIRGIWHKIKLLNEEELLDFRNSGLINFENFNDELKFIDKIFLYYHNVDVIYKEDHNFVIEYDITIEKDDDINNYAFTLQFKRKIFIESMSVFYIALAQVIGWLFDH
jgi:hypothetical protein